MKFPGEQEREKEKEKERGMDREHIIRNIKLEAKKQKWREHEETGRNVGK